VGAEDLVAGHPVGIHAGVQPFKRPKSRIQRHSAAV
jgi:hypothetical protein